MADKVGINAYDINVTTFYLQTAKHIDQRSKDIVNHYLRVVFAQQLDLNFDIIPPLINCLCLIYYYQWDQFNSAQNIKLSNFDMSIKYIPLNIPSSQINVFGTTWINEMDNKIFIWTFKIEQVNDSSSLAIGISSFDANYLSSYKPFYDCNKPAFALLNSGAKVYNTRPFGLSYSNYRFRTGSIVQMRLNAAFGELSFIIDGISAGVAFDKIFKRATRFKMAVLVSSPNDSVTLQSLDYMFF